MIPWCGLRACAMCMCMCVRVSCVCVCVVCVRTCALHTNIEYPLPHPPAPRHSEHCAQRELGSGVRAHPVIVFRDCARVVGSLQVLAGQGTVAMEMIEQNPYLVSLRCGEAW